MGKDYAVIVEGLYAGGGCIRAPRVDAVICLDPSCRVEAEGAVEYCYPLFNGSVEPLGNFTGALLKLIELRRRGASVYVHCMAGCGRTGTLIAAYLVLEEGLGVEEAIAYYRLRRGCGPETWEQYEFLYALGGLVERVGAEEAIRVLESSRNFEEFLGRARSV